jgi:hypothetical protein
MNLGKLKRVEPQKSWKFEQCTNSGKKGKKGTQEYGENEKVEQYKSWAIDEPKHDKGEIVGQSMKMELVGRFGIGKKWYKGWKVEGNGFHLER